jgi:glycyl-tRNA synthetase beta chain
MLFDAANLMTLEVEEALNKRDYSAACQALAKLKGPVDALFDKVLVMAEEPKLRQNRLALLARISQTFLKMADFSKITT